MAGQNLLDAVGVGVRYGKAVAVEGASLRVAAGSATALVGPNGAGKSSLFNALAGVVPVSGGAIEFGGRDITRMRPTARARSGLVLVPQGRQLFPSLSVKENLQVVADALKCPAGALEEALDRFPILRARSSALAGVLSGGEQQMLAIARGLMSGPKLLLLDEPTLGLAPSVVSELMETVGSFAREGVAVVFAEPSMRLLRGFIEGGSVLVRGQVAASATSYGELELAYQEKMGLVDGREDVPEEPVRQRRE